MKYKVSLKKTEDGYAVWVPGLPGCWSQGKREEEALEKIKDAIQAYLETVEELSKGVSLYRRRIVMPKLSV
jgi:predicted RNase H-like HicB family nuclease